MRKITSLLMMLCMFVGAVNAEVTKYYKPGERLSTLTEGQKVMFYNTCLPDGQDRTGFLIDNAGWFALNKQKPSDAPIFSEKVGVWTLENVTNTDGVYTVNVKGANGYVGIGGKTNNADAQVLRFQEWTAADAGKKAGVNSENAAGTTVNNADISAEDKVWLVTNADQSTTWNGNQTSFATWSTGHPYAVYSVVEATTADLEAMLATAKTNAVNELNALKQLTAIYTTVETAISSVNAVELENDDLETALNTINTLVANVKAEANGKNVKLCNKESDGRAGNYLGYDKANNRAAAIADGGDAAIWTIKVNADGTFKLYNWVNNHYLGAPADPTPVVTDEASAPSFKFIVTDENVVAIATGDKMVHIANHSNYKVINYWSTTDAASLWDVTVVPEIVVTRDQYNAAVAAKATLPYGIQQAYGLVTDASQYYSNWKSEAEGSYEALLDNTESSYFHSAYTDEAKAAEAETHYIQADLGEGNSVDQFYFYMLPRSGNGNNRPKNITIYGSNDNSAFTEIAQVTTTLDSSMNPYMSAKIGTEGTNYRYIRFTVNSTNTSTKFFTLSELYILPASVSDVATLVDAYNNFSTTSITSNDFATYANALVNGEATLALANIKKEINALLTANATNHAETPALGQYSTAAYNALQAAYNATDATQESLEAAIAAFKKAKNLPVFTIDGVVDYAAGKSIYDDPGNVNAKGNTHYFKATNVYDKTMWWALDMTATEVGVIDEVGIYNVGTGNGFWGASSIQITETEPADATDGIFLFYTTGNGSPIHYQNDNQLITRWGDKGAASGSAHKFTYIGSTYQLAQLTDEKIAALAGLQTAYNAVAYLKDATLGSGLGQYTGSKDAIVEAVTDAEAIGAKTLAEQAVLDVATIVAATTALNECADDLTINLPEAGKYYRFQGACEASLPGYYITGHTNNDGGRIALTAEADASTIYYFDGTNLVAYQSGLVIGLNAGHYTFASVDDNSQPASTITFAGSPRKVGAYTIKSADRYFHYKVFDGTVEIDRCSSDTHAEHAWYITEVTELPVTITAAGYATFYAPVEVTLPAEVTAHTVTENGEYATLSGAISVVPAENGVILAGEANTYNLAVSNTEAADLEGALAGTVAKTLVTKDAGAYYVLGVVEGAVGLYNPVIGEDDTKFYNAGHKAYWHIPAASQVAGFRFGGNTTAIESVLIGTDANAPIYDLSGRRVNNAVKGGIYIVNGKKVYVK